MTQDRVTDISNTLSYQRNFTYDPVGNRLSQTIDEGAGATTITSSYDTRDRLRTVDGRMYGWDASGRLTSQAGEGSTTYEWNSESSLVRVTVDDGTLVETTYDADGNRVRTAVTAQGETTVVVDYLVDTASFLSHVVADVVNQQVQRLYIRADDQLVGFLQPASMIQRYYHADGLGSVRALSDDMGEVTDRYAFTAFGELTEHQGNDSNAYLFAGERLEPNSCFYYLRARWLDSSAGRFVGMDPLMGSPRDPRSLHKYLYAHLDPINSVDPTGKYTLTQAMATLANIAVLALSALSIIQGVHHISEGKIARGAIEVALGFMGVGAFVGSVRFLSFATGPINAAIRVRYLAALDDMAALVPRMRAAGQSSERIARTVVQMRNAAKIDARAVMIQEGGFAGKVIVKGLELANRIRYGNPVGPTAEWLLARKGSWDAVVSGATRANQAVNRFSGVL